MTQTRFVKADAETVTGPVFDETVDRTKYPPSTV